MITSRQQLLLDQWNATDRDYPTDMCLHQLIEQQVERTPDSVALMFEGQTMSYRHLNAEANRVAWALVNRGVKPGVFVGICTHRSFEMLIGLVAILKAGAAYVPLDPGYPTKRIHFMINDSAAPVILTQKRHRDIPHGVSAQILCLDDRSWYENSPDTNTNTITNTITDAKSAADDPAYAIYTSGSTGNPKGAVNPHRAVVNRLLWMRDDLKLGASDRFFQKTPFSFDVSVWELFLPLIVGAPLVISRPDGHKDTEYLVKLIGEQRITVVHFVPSMLRLFLAAFDLRPAQCLNTVVCSGEALSADLEKLFFQKFPRTALYNLYGPTEAAVDVTAWKCRPDSTSSVVPIGYPIANVRMYVVAQDGTRVAPGETGELCIAGIAVAKGYLNRDELTQEKFVPDPFSSEKDARMYRTGDLGRHLEDGAIEYLGRIDHQVKIRGFRIELGEIENALRDVPGVDDCAVVARRDSTDEQRLIAYLTQTGGKAFSIGEARARLSQKLPDYMIPALFITIAQMPLNASGKLDRKALPAPQRTRPDLSTQYVSPRTALQKLLASVWSELLMVDRVGIEDNFFELGGSSILALRLSGLLRERHGLNLPVVRLFQHPTIALLEKSLAEGGDKENEWLERIDDRATRQRIGRTSADSLSDGVAVIGMAGRFPGAQSIEQLWRNLCDGVESITFFKPEELSLGIEEDVKTDPDYIMARGIVEDADKFDAAFFGINPREAAVIDPQQRVFLELAWAALEHAGYTAEDFWGLIGVYAGVGDNHYYPVNLLTRPDLLNIVGKLAVEYGNEKDYIATRVSYALDLTGPSVSANTGCSSSLLAVDNAFHALENYECDMALAGGVDIGIPQKRGFLFQEGGVFAKDGHCRPFDADATGTMFNDGAGIVVLKRLADALADGDTVYAVIRGSAKNNDGAHKASFLAPSVEGQAAVIAMAQARANVDPESISYIEAHGTGTPIGDPIEVEALCKAFGARTGKKQFCGIGSIKGNIGHPTIASGVAGFIKATLALYHEKIPPTLHYKNPNPRIDFPDTPFKVVDKLQPFLRTPTPRRVGVSSFGFGGTNVHTILEEAPVQKPSGDARSWQLLPLSAKTPESLARSVSNLREYLVSNPDLNLADAAATLQRGRVAFSHRQFFVCRDSADALIQLQNPEPGRSARKNCETRQPQVVFMFPGQGSQYVNMGKALYEDEPVFRDVVDRCATLLQPHLECDLRDFMFPAPGDEQTASVSLTDTYYTQPAIFTIEYALASLWMHWGVQPSVMIGHSIGEFVAACLGGVFELEDVLKLVAARGRLMRDLPRGSMMSVRAAASEIENIIPSGCSLAAINGPRLCVAAGPTDSIDEFGEKMEAQGIACRKLHTSHAFHSPMMDSVVEPFLEIVSSVRLRRSKIPLMSTVTGEWVDETTMMDPHYWASHLRSTVRFSQGIRALLKEPDRVFFEVGPRRTLSVLTRQHTAGDAGVSIVPAMGDTAGYDAEWAAVLGAVGNLWLSGVSPDWEKFNEKGLRRRIALPTYSFEPVRHWIDPIPKQASLKTVTEIMQQQLPANESTDISEKMQLKTDPPAGGLEMRLKSTFAKISGVDYEKTGSDVTFFELGLDSLLLTQISRALYAEYGVRIAFRDLAERYTTFAALTEQVENIAPKPADKSSATVSTQAPSRPLKEPDNKGITTSGASCCATAPATPQTPGNQTLEALKKLIKLCGKAGIPVPEYIREASGGAEPEDDNRSRAASGSTTGAHKPPVPGARLGRDQDGNPAWFIPDPKRPGKYLRVSSS